VADAPDAALESQYEDRQAAVRHPALPEHPRLGFYEKRPNHAAHVRFGVNGVVMASRAVKVFRELQAAVFVRLLDDSK
jgi:hypothetical protein